ncbi:MAG: DUF3365 domain-containing protein [Deltaproteobacteria bacterium]|nr:DUF3365 domain-containing protein [Deltaproteobacteria bacterium]
MKNIRFSLQAKFLLSIILIIIPTLGVIFTWAAIQNENQAKEQVINQARILSKQIILTRQWISDCGGVMVPRDSKGAQDINCFFDDRLETSRGWFQRFTPSMATRKLSQYSIRQNLYRFRLASLAPLNPENRSDDFERESLIKFAEKGLAETFKFGIHSEDYNLRYMAPLYLEKACLECHHAGEVSKSGIRGGLSIILPIKEMQATVKTNQIKLAISGVVLICLVTITLFFLMRRMVITPLKDIEKMTAEIGAGNLEARVAISTGDEFEKLGTAFNTMAERISRGRDILKERVAQSTSELSEANEELKTLDKLKSDFLANMSHELRSPLTVIRGGIDYLNRTVQKEDNRSYLAIIDKNLARLINLVSDLFDFTKIEARKIEWSFEEENLTTLIQEVIEIISPLAVEKQITITCENPGDVIVKFDLERIEQVLVNLIENAIKFSDPETTICISIQADQESVTVAIKDCGIGISKKNLEIIFDKFSTVPSGRDGQIEGTGLGLAISKAIIEAHGGRIWAESIKGVSSTFFFTLPKNRT